MAMLWQQINYGHLAENCLHLETSNHPYKNYI